MVEDESIINLRSGFILMRLIRNLKHCAHEFFRQPISSSVMISDQKFMCRFVLWSVHVCFQSINHKGEGSSFQIRHIYMAYPWIKDKNISFLEAKGRGKVSIIKFKTNIGSCCCGIFLCISDFREAAYFKVIFLLIPPELSNENMLM